MATLADLLGLAPKPKPTPSPDPGFNPDRPWDTPLPRLAEERMAAPAPSPSPSPYGYAPPDPFGQAQHLAQRQGALSQLARPATPVLEVPQGLLDLISGWVRREKAKK